VPLREPVLFRKLSLCQSFLLPGSGKVGTGFVLSQFGKSIFPGCCGLDVLDNSKDHLPMIGRFAPVFAYPRMDCCYVMSCSLRKLFFAQINEILFLK
jgi:hypothetical protein